jgi:protein O-mannosyl-transferase
VARRRLPRADATPAADGAKPHTVRWRTVFVIAGLVAFSVAWDAPFVFDDHESIVRNPYVGRLWPLSAPPQSAVAGRPVIAMSLAISHAIDGLNPAVFRAWNLAVHITAGLLLFAVLRRTLTITPRSMRSPSAPRSSG